MTSDPVAEHWHHLSVAQVAELLETDPEEGLDLFEVKLRRERFGPNSLTERRGHGPLVRFLLQFNDPLLYILMAAGAVTLYLGEWIDATVIFGVVVLNAIIGYVQEAKAVEALKALAQTMTAEATVIRAGKQTSVPADELVPGDLVVLQSGDKVPADLRLIRARDLQIDESALTGESLPVEKDAHALVKDTPLPERVCMAYASTLVTYGAGRGIVVATGDGTEVGRISELIAEAGDLQTPLTRKLAQFSKMLLIAILAVGVVTFGVGLLRGASMFGVFQAAIALAVAAVPEGLPAAVTIVLAIGVSRMARRRAIIRKLPAVETLGSTSVICTDKTGTLTENQMTVQLVVAGGRTYVVEGSGYEPQGSIRPQLDEAPAGQGDGHFSAGDGGEAQHAGEPVGIAEKQVKRTEDVALLECLRAGLLCNDSRVVESDGRWSVQGDPTEGALEVVARKAGLHRDEEEAALPRLDTIPFESRYQYMATLHRDGDGLLVYVKGSAEAVLARCSAELGSDGRTLELDRRRVNEAVERMAAAGLRVLAFARKETASVDGSLSHEDVRRGLVLLGLQAMIDPPRPEAIKAVAACRSAGVAVKMITGDHAVTAAAIADRMGIGDPAEAGESLEEAQHVTAGGVSSLRRRVLTGRELEEMRDSRLIEIVEDVAVFARVSPEQKLRLVEALQARGNVVAMTGDGVNDAPALKQADIGVAMGVTGTDVAKEAADMVLTDDNFASVEAAVEEGRGVFDNLVKFVTYALPTNLGQGLVLLTAIFAGLVLPILPLQILWINMVTAVFLGMGLAFEPKEAGLMTRPPRPPGAPILTRDVLVLIVAAGIVLQIGAFGLFEIARRRGVPIDEARTIAVNTFMAIQALYLFNCRSLRRTAFRVSVTSNWMLLAGVGITVALQAMFTYAPFMNVAFDSVPLDAGRWWPIVLVAIAAFLFIELVKAVQNRVGGSGGDVGCGRRPVRGQSPLDSPQSGP